MTQKSRRYLLHEASYSQFCPKYRCHGNGGRSGKNAIGSIRWPIPEKPPTGAKILQKISYASRVIAHFVPNFVAMATGVGRGKCNWQHSMAHPRKRTTFTVIVVTVIANRYCNASIKASCRKLLRTAAVKLQELLKADGKWQSRQLVEC